MALDLQDPVDVFRNFRCDLVQRHGQLAELFLALRPKAGSSLREQHFGLEDKAVADDPHIIAATKHFAKAAEEFGSEALQLLDPRGQRVVQRFAKACDGDLVTRRLRLLLCQKARQLLDPQPQRRHGVGHLRDLGLRGGVLRFKFADAGKRADIARGGIGNLDL